MPKLTPPRPYREWRTDPADREEDAANTFGYHVVKHCRKEALAKVSRAASPDTRAAVEEAVDVALHNVFDLLEGFWRTNAGRAHRVEYALVVRVRNRSDSVVESIEISRAKLDLPIGYWKWRDGDFR